MEEIHQQKLPEKLHHCLYLLIAIAKVDGIASEEELNTVFKRSKLLNWVNDTVIDKSNLNVIYQEWEADSYNERFEKVKTYLNSVCTDHITKEAILHDASVIIESDGVVKNSEINFYRLLERSLIN